MPYSFPEVDWERLGATPWKVLTRKCSQQTIFLKLYIIIYYIFLRLRATRRCSQQTIFLMLLLIIITVVKSIIICMRYKNDFPLFHVCQVYLRDLHLLEHLNRKMLRGTKVSYDSNSNPNTNTDNLITITNSNIFSNLQAANVNRSLLGGIKVAAANTEV